MNRNQKKTLKNVLFVIGTILLLVEIVKVSIIGYYENEIPLYIGMLIVAFICLYISHKISYKLKSEEDS